MDWIRRICVPMMLFCAVLGLRGMYRPDIVGRMVQWSATTSRKLPGRNNRPRTKPTKVTTLASTHRDRGDLPSFENGGVVFFYHIYKTGGSTVGKMLHEIASTRHRIHFTMIRKNIDWQACLWALRMAEHGKKTVIIEFHIEHPAPQFPSLVEIAPTVDRWRTEAHKRRLGFFSFTLVREPVAHAISFFNFFSVGSQKEIGDWNPFKRMSATPENFMRTFVGNRQCQMLGTDPESTGSVPADVLRQPIPSNDSDRRISPGERDDDLNYLSACHSGKVKQVLYRTLDWVGTTEDLSNVTLPLLTKLLLDDASVGQKIKPFKVFSKNVNKIKGVKRKDLPREALDRILEETELDRDIYEEVLKNNTLRGLGLDLNFRSFR